MPATRLLQQKFVHRALTLALLLFVTLTMTSLWAAPQEEEGTGIPAYNAGPPPKGTKLPPSLPKINFGEPMRNIRTRPTPMSWQRRFRLCSTSSPAIAFATAWATTASIAALRAPTARRCATCLKELYYSYQAAPGRARPQRRFAPALSRAIGSRSIWNQPRRSTRVIPSPVYRARKVFGIGGALQVTFYGCVARYSQLGTRYYSPANCPIRDTLGDT